MEGTMRSDAYSVLDVSKVGFLICLLFVSLFWFPFVFGDPFLTGPFVAQRGIQSRLAGSPDSWPWQLTVAVRYCEFGWLRLTVMVLGLCAFIALLCCKPKAIVTEAVFHVLIWIGLAGIYICVAGIFVVA